MSTRKCVSGYEKLKKNKKTKKKKNKKEKLIESQNDQ